MPNGKPSILIPWGNDIGWWNISYNSRGQMGYRTPNTDRIRTYKVHLDGFNRLPYLSSEVKESPRNSLFYFSDDGEPNPDANLL